MPSKKLSPAQHAALYNLRLYGRFRDDQWGRASIRVTKPTVEALHRTGCFAAVPVEELATDTGGPLLCLSETGRAALEAADEAVAAARAEQAGDDELHLTDEEATALIGAGYQYDEWTNGEWVDLPVTVRIGLASRGLVGPADELSIAPDWKISDVDWQVTERGVQARKRHRGNQATDETGGEDGISELLLALLRRAIDVDSGYIGPDTSLHETRELTRRHLIEATGKGVTEHRFVTVAGLIAADRADQIAPSTMIDQAAHEYYRLRGGSDGLEAHAAYAAYFARSTPPGIDPARFQSAVTKAAAILFQIDGERVAHQRRLAGLKAAFTRATTWPEQAASGEDTARTDNRGEV